MRTLAIALLILLLPLAANVSFAADGIHLAAGGSGASTRAPGNLDSWTALLILASSFVIAWCLNYSAPRVRAIGSALAAFGCLAVAGWFFFFILQSGFLENPKPNQTPLDSAKPGLLWIQACLALLSGLILIAVAYRQAGSEEVLALADSNEPHRYGRISRFLHWSTAILFIALIPMGIFTSIIPEGTAFRNAYYVVHKTLGVTVFMLLIVRLAWNARSKRPSLDASLKPLERKLAHGAHLALYGMLIALPLTGFMMTSYHGYPTFFFAWELPPLWAPSDEATILWGSLHKYLLPYLLYIILGAHILGALKHRYVDKHAGALKRIVG